MEHFPAFDFGFHIDFGFHGSYSIEEESEEHDAAHDFYGGHCLCPAVGGGIVAESEGRDSDDAIIEPRAKVGGTSVGDAELSVRQSPVYKCEDRHQAEVYAYPGYWADVGYDVEKMSDTVGDRVCIHCRRVVNTREGILVLCLLY